jgi:hypothetical protein
MDFLLYKRTTILTKQKKVYNVKPTDAITPNPIISVAMCILSYRKSKIGVDSP